MTHAIGDEGFALPFPLPFVGVGAGAGEGAVIWEGEVEGAAFFFLAIL